MSISQWVYIVPTVATLLSVTGCVKSAAEPEHALNELTPSKGGIVLTRARRDQLGIQITGVLQRRLKQTQKRVGWFIAPPGSETVIRSPVAGFVGPAPSQQWPRIGEATELESRLAQVNVFLTPQEVSQLILAKEDNDIQMQQALVTMELSESQLKLATNARDAVTGVRINQLKEAYEHSKVAYKEAQDKLPFLIQEPYVNGALLKPLPVSSAKGRILQAHVSQGQFVQAGEPLWTISNWTTLWLRVPVFTGELNRFLPPRSALVELPGASHPVPAEPLNVPSAVQPQTRTVDLLFSVANADWQVRVGQSAVVELPTSNEFDCLVIPRSAVLYDGFGQAYCYAAETGEDAFQRRRIELGSVTEAGVAILHGLDAHDVVVSAGTEQLAAEQSKSELAVGDDD